MATRHIIAVMLTAAICACHTTTSAHAATSIDAKCTAHAVSAVPPTTNLWHVRIGTKPGGDATHRCHGTYKKKAGKADGLAFWQPFSLPDWNWTHVLDITATCAGFGAAFVLELPSAFLATGILVASGVGCVTATVHFGNEIYPPDDAGVPVVK